MKGRIAPDDAGLAVIKQLGENIRKARRLSHISGTVLAQLIDRTRSSVSEWETGTHPPDLWMLPRIAEALGVSFDFLFYGTIRMPTRNSAEWLQRRALDQLEPERLRALLQVPLPELDEFLASRRPPPGGDEKPKKVRSL